MKDRFSAKRKLKKYIREQKRPSSKNDFYQLFVFIQRKKRKEIKPFFNLSTNFM